MVGFVFLSPLKFSSYSRWKYHSFSCINTLDKWTAAPSPLRNCGEKGLKKLAPDHLNPGASFQHSRGREIFGPLNCFSASIAPLSLPLSLSFFFSFCHGIWVGEDTAGTRILDFPNILKFLSFVLYPDTHGDVQNVDLPLQISKALSTARVQLVQWLFLRSGHAGTYWMRVGYNSPGCVQIV